MTHHQLTVTTDQLDQIVQSLMKSSTANIQKRRRLKAGSQQAARAETEYRLLQQVIAMAMAAQEESFTP